MSEQPEFEWDPYAAVVIDDIPGVFGTSVKVGVLAHAVIIGVADSPGILDTPEARDRFARAWMEACRRADGEAPAAEAAPTREETDRCGYSDDPFHRCRVCYDYAAGREREHPLTAGAPAAGAREHG